MWPHEEQLKSWFEGVEAKRKAKYGGDNSSSSDDAEEVPLMQNELVEHGR